MEIKRLTLLLMLLLILPIVSAELNDGICDNGENPVWHPNECPLKFDLKYAWCLYLLIAGVLGILLYNKFKAHKNILLIISVLLLLFMFMAPEEQIKEKTNIIYNTTNTTEKDTYTIDLSSDKIEVPKSSLEKGFDWFFGLGKRVAGEHSSPIIGWVFIIFVVWILLSIFGVLDNFKDKFIKNKLRRFR